MSDATPWPAVDPGRLADAERDGDRISTIDLFDGSFILLAGPKGEAWRIAALKARGGIPGLTLVAHRVEVRPAGSSLLDPDGLFTAAFGISPAGAVLVRPDGYVAWRAKGGALNSTGVLRRVLRKVLARPGG